MKSCWVITTNSDGGMCKDKTHVECANVLCLSLTLSNQSKYLWDITDEFATLTEYIKRSDLITKRSKKTVTSSHTFCHATPTHMPISLSHNSFSFPYSFYLGFECFNPHRT